MKFCINCQYLINYSKYENENLNSCFLYCNHPKFREISLVTGNEVTRFRLCQDVRNDNSACGEEGNWFKPKENV